MICLLILNGTRLSTDRAGDLFTGRRARPIIQQGYRGATEGLERSLAAPYTTHSGGDNYVEFQKSAKSLRALAGVFDRYYRRRYVLFDSIR